MFRCRFLGAELAARRWIKGGVAAAAVTAVFFVVGQLLQSVFNPQGLVLNVVVGLAVAGALWPAERAAGRLATRLVRNVDGDGYRAQRRVAIFGHAARVAWRDGHMHDHEAVALRRLGEGLGLSHADMARLEVQAREARAGAPGQA